MWTEFFDMSSGGTDKTEFRSIYIEADERTAAIYFERRFGFSPYVETYECCGPDFYISSCRSPSHRDGVLIVGRSEI